MVDWGCDFHADFMDLVVSLDRYRQVDLSVPIKADEKRVYQE
jgi:hypothetical protein